MTDNDMDVIAELKADVEQRFREQLNRHFRINPNADRRQVVEIQLRQERERLELKAAKFEDQGEENLAEICRFLADEWLPILSKEL
jgi:uncharacterized protein YggU (UPF0235/DUF167 family)